MAYFIAYSLSAYSTIYEWLIYLALLACAFMETVIYSWCEWRYFLRSWWLGYLAGVSKLTRSFDWVLGACVWHALRVPVVGTSLPFGESRSFMDHCGGDAQETKMLASASKD